MKKIVSVLLIALMALCLLSSCGKTEKKAENVNVSVLNGTTGFGMAYLMEQNASSASSNKYTFSVETDASVITSALIKGDIDIAALPTNAAANVYTKTNGGVQIIAVNTLGVLYVVENGTSIKSVKDLEGKTVYCPAQNPKFILEYILTKNNVNATIDTTYAAPADLRTAVAAGKVEIAVLPEPMVTIAKSANSSLNVALDLTQEWNKTEEENSLVQGCVVVRTEFAKEYPDSVSLFLDEYKKSIEYVNENPEGAAELIAKYNIFANQNVAKAAIPKCNIAFLEGNEMKNAMSAFLEAMYSVNPASVGGALPNDDFYYSR